MMVVVTVVVVRVAVVVVVEVVERLYIRRVPFPLIFE